MKLQDLLKIILDYWQIEIDALIPLNRNRKLVFIRQTFFYFAIFYDMGTLKEIGLIFNRDHATALHAYNKLSGFMDIGFKPVTKHIDNIRSIIEKRPNFDIRSPKRTFFPLEKFEILKAS